MTEVGSVLDMALGVAEVTVTMDDQQPELETAVGNIKLGKLWFLLDLYFPFGM